MKRAFKQQGFTIVETMIVLAISGFLFLSAVILVGGQQNKAAFAQAIQDVQSVIQEHMNEVGDGFYSNSGNFTCTGNTGTLRITSGVSPQGSNTGCIFLGKVLQFGVKSTDPQQFVTYAIAGLRADSNGNLIQTFAAANPVVVAPGTNTNQRVPDSSTTDLLHNGLTVVSMKYVNGGSSQSIGAVGFVSGLGSFDPSSSKLLSGSQQISLVPIPGTQINVTKQTGVDDINRNLARAPVDPDNGSVQICFASGGTNQSGLMTIGGNGRQLAVTLDIKDGRTC